MFVDSGEGGLESRSSSTSLAPPSLADSRVVTRSKRHHIPPGDTPDLPKPVVDVVSSRLRGCGTSKTSTLAPREERARMLANESRPRVAEPGGANSESHHLVPALCACVRGRWSAPAEDPRPMNVRWSMRTCSARAQRSPDGEHSGTSGAISASRIRSSSVRCAILGRRPGGTTAPRRPVRAGARPAVSCELPRHPGRSIQVTSSPARSWRPRWTRPSPVGTTKQPSPRSVATRSPRGSSRGTCEAVVRTGRSGIEQHARRRRWLTRCCSGGSRGSTENALFDTFWTRMLDWPR